MKALALHTLAEFDLGPPRDGVQVARTATVRDALALLIEKHAEMLAVTDPDGRVVGSLTKDELLA